MRREIEIQGRPQKLQKVVEFIETEQIKRTNKFRRGPSLYFYRQVIELRKQHKNVREFLDDSHNLEMLYSALVSWGMDSRAARMIYYDDFRDSLLSPETKNALCEVEKVAQLFCPEDCEEMLRCLERVYEKLNLMESGGRLISNSKCLHFLFPSLCMPMDTNTLNYLYGNTGESATKYKEAARFSFEIMSKHKDFDRFRDGEWNTTIPKMIDNAIILLWSDAQKQRQTS
jgi:hypothetical protein